MKTNEELASEYATHKKDCICKGSNFSSDKYKAFLACAEIKDKEIELLNSWVKHHQRTVEIKLAQNHELSKEIEELKNKLRVAIIALEEIKDTKSFSPRSTVASEALEKIKGK